jgi:23S rRNA (uracil1939-C5)-methyltransferase
MIELDITALAAGGDGVGREDSGRVVFVPRSAPGDRVRVKLTLEKKQHARGEIVEIVRASPDRVAPPCPHFVQGCGGCAWQHVARPAQLAAKQAIVDGALRKLEGLAIERIADPCPPFGWRRRARFHVANGVVGLYAYGSRNIIPIASCPQLEPELDAALRAYTPSADGELSLVRGHRGDIAIGVGTIELEPGLHAGPTDFAQASAAGNAALIELARTAAGKGPGRMLELYAGAGNFTRAFREDGWDVTPSDVVAQAVEGFEHGPVERVLARVRGPFDVIVLDPPRTGAAEAIDGIAKLAPPRIVYISCDPATLARDAARLVAHGYRAERAWPVDVMPQTAHVEVVLTLRRM